VNSGNGAHFSQSWFTLSIIIPPVPIFIFTHLSLTLSSLDTDIIMK